MELVDCLIEDCPVSSSRQSDDGTGDDSQSSGRLPVESVGIIMLSFPGSADDEAATYDEFQTPLEEVHPASSAEQRTPAADRKDEVQVSEEKEDLTAADLSCTDGEASVELGKDSELGFSSSTSMVKVVAFSHVGVGTSSESLEKFMVLPRKSIEASGKSPSKKPKIYDENLARGSPKGSVKVAPVKNVTSPLKSPQILNRNSVNSANCTPLSSPNNQGDGTMLLEDSLVKKKPYFPESEVENAGVFSGPGEDPMKMDLDVDVAKEGGVENGKCNVDTSEVDELQSIVGRDTARANIEDVEVVKYILTSVHNDPPPPTILSKVPQRRCELPLSIGGPAEDAATDSVMGDLRQVTVVDVLKLLCGQCDRNPEEHEETDILEIAKRRGMTFPRPRWWSP